MAIRPARVMKSESVVIIKKPGYPLYAQLKAKQLKFIMEFIRGRGLFVVLSVGFEKTLYYTSTLLFLLLLINLPVRLVLVLMNFKGHP